MSLARLWQRQGRRDDAHTALAAVYGTFTEGFTTPDLMDAAALLQSAGHHGAAQHCPAHDPAVRPCSPA
jgi:predicted ATPase